MGPSIWQLVIVLVIVLLLFGTKRLRNIGGDLGGAIRSFRGAMKDGGKAAEDDDPPAQLSTEEAAAAPGEGVSAKERDRV